MFAIRNDIDNDDDDDNDIGDNDNNDIGDVDDEKRSIFRVNETLYLLKILFSIMFHIFTSLYIFILHVLFFYILSFRTWVVALLCFTSFTCLP